MYTLTATVQLSHSEAHSASYSTDTKGSSQRVISACVENKVLCAGILNIANTSIVLIPAHGGHTNSEQKCNQQKNVT